MRKKIILPFFVVVVLVGLGIVAFFILKTGSAPPSATTPSVVTPSISNTPIPVTVILNKNNYPLYLVDGLIDKISSIDPMKLDVKIRINKIFPDQNEKEVVKTIIVKNDTEFVLHNLTTKKGNSMESSSLKAGDSVAIWTVEPNTDILKLDQFTATKIIKFQ